MDSPAPATLPEGTTPVLPGGRNGKRKEYRTVRKGDVKLPKKKFYRQRAHANPFSDHNLE